MDTFEDRKPDSLEDGTIAQEAQSNPDASAAQPAETVTEDPVPEQFAEVEENLTLDAAAELPGEPLYAPAQEYEATEQVEDEPVKTQTEYVNPMPTSPFADSPYVTAYAGQDHSQPPKSSPPIQRKRKKSGFWKTALCAVLILALVVGACYATAEAVDSRWQRRMAKMENEFSEKLDSLEAQIKASDTGEIISGIFNGAPDGSSLTPAQVYAMNVRSVVMIRNQYTSMTGQTGYSTGSGFILTEDGYVVTNHHVIEGNGQLTVITSDGQSYDAKLIGSDNTNDVALVKIEAKGLRAVTIGSSSDLVVGDQVVAIGNPLGELTSTLTVGYISAKERDVNTDGFAINMLQTDAAINSGNSGGPLFNMRGEVVGITTAKYSGTSSSGATIEGVGFAIPIDDVNSLLSDLATLGYVSGGFLGVKVSDMDPEAANYYGMPVGAYVNSVENGGAAQRAGIRSKDIIVKLGDYEIGNVNDLSRALRNYKAGDAVTVIIFRAGAEVELTVVLDDRPAS